MPRIPKEPKVSVRGVAQRVRRDNNRLAKEAGLRAAARVADKIQSVSGITADEAASHLTNDSFQNFALSLGMGTDNAMSASGYGFNPITRQRILLEWVHRGTWLGGMAVDLVADDMTRAGIDLKGQVQPDDLAKLDETAGTLGIWESVNDTVRWSRLFGGCLAVMMIDGQRYDTELRLNTVGKDSFKGLVVFDRWQVEPSLDDLVTEPGPSLGLPKYYRVVDDSSVRIKERIHYSRCLRLEGVRLPYYQRIMENLWGMSIIERIYDRLTMFDAATSGASQLIHKSFLRTLKMKGLREALANGGKAQKGVVAQVSMMRRFQQNEGISVIDGDDEFTVDQSSGIAGMADMLGRFGEQLSGALQIPLVRLFGQSPAGFSSGESDLRMYYDGIRQQQNRHLRFPLVRIYRAMARSLGINLPEGFNIQFNPLWQLTEKEQAETAVVITNAVNEALTMGAIDKPTAMKELRQSSDVTGVFTNITDEQIEAAEREGAITEPPGPEQAQGEAPVGEGKEVEPSGQPAHFAAASASLTPKALPKTVQGEKEGPALAPTAAKEPTQAPGKRPGEPDQAEAEDGALPQFDGLDYAIETPKGAVRQPWGVVMPAHYGYIKGTGSAEGWHEGMDCYIGDSAQAKRVFVVHQKDLKTNEFDEHKTLLGFDSAASALDCYTKSFNDGKGRDRIMRVEAMSLDGFKRWLHDNWRVERAKAQS